MMMCHWRAVVSSLGFERGEGKEKTSADAALLRTLSAVGTLEAVQVGGLSLRCGFESGDTRRLWVFEFGSGLRQA